jgi:hypothetical protein
VYSFWTIVKTSLDTCQVSKFRGRKEPRTGRKGRLRTRAAVGSALPKLFLMNETTRTAGLTGGNLAALPAAEDARHNE